MATQMQGADTSAFEGLLTEGAPGGSSLKGFSVEEELLNIYQDPETPPEAKQKILDRLGGIQEAGAEGRQLSDLFERITSPERTGTIGRMTIYTSSTISDYISSFKYYY